MLMSIGGGVAKDWDVLPGGAVGVAEGAWPRHRKEGEGAPCGRVLTQPHPQERVDPTAAANPDLHLNRATVRPHGGAGLGAWAALAPPLLGRSPMGALCSCCSTWSGSRGRWRG